MENRFRFKKKQYTIMNIEFVSISSGTRFKIFLSKKNPPTMSCIKLKTSESIDIINKLIYTHFNNANKTIFVIELL
jgi:hypothetical protein